MDMTTDRLLNELLRPTYVLRMAGALLSPGGDPLRPMSDAEKPPLRGAQTRYKRSLREIERLLATWAATQQGHGYDGRSEVHPGYPGDPRTCLYGSLGWVWINDGETGRNLVCPVCGLDGT